MVLIKYKRAIGVWKVILKDDILFDLYCFNYKIVIFGRQHTAPKPAITVGILLSLLGFWASKVEFVKKFKIMEHMFALSIWQYQIHPFHFVRGWIYYLADTFEIAVVHSSISCL